MLNLKKIKNKCTGCSTCINICPKKAISMQIDQEGFIYPVINEKKCINCHLCEKVCPILNNIKNENLIPKKVIAAKSIDKQIQISSSSGGIFTELAKEIIKQNGIVFGATFEEGIVKHISINKIKDLIKLRGSKYLQSYVNESFKEVEKYLNLKKPVLFSGTPCQIAGLKSFLKIKRVDTSNLLLIDLVCHGVPSYKVFQDYIKNDFPNKTLSNINFRDKKGSWPLFNITYFFNKSANISRYHKVDPFFIGYLKNYYLRESCYKCKFSELPRQGDITLGDFWGISKNLFDPNGVSLVLINNKKGEIFFKRIDHFVCYNFLNIDLVSENTRLFKGNYPEFNHILRNKFFLDYQEEGYKFIEKKYLKIDIIKRIVLNIKKHLRD